MSCQSLEIVYIKKDDPDYLKKCHDIDGNKYRISWEEYDSIPGEIGIVNNKRYIAEYRGKK